MIDCDALIVGGGPAGSTCARALRRVGWDVIILDRARFPRDKVCGGWLTPPVFNLLDLPPSEYRASGCTLQAITGFRTGLLRPHSIGTSYPDVVSYAIRRCEFDAFLLRRSGVRVLEETPLATLRRGGGSWIANDKIRTPVVIGAGGHFCPVARRFGDRTAARPVVAKEAEYRVDGNGTTVDPRVPELFFCDDLEGYGWCVRKDDYLNIGIGRRDNADFGVHVNRFIDFLESSGKAPAASQQKWRGHAYLASGIGRRAIVADGVLLIGDAAGLAYPESGEGIRPAIESALLAAGALAAARGRHAAEDLQPYQAAIGRRHPQAGSTPSFARPALIAAGRALLGSRWFTRRFVLDRWFLRTGGRYPRASRRTWDASSGEVGLT